MGIFLVSFFLHVIKVMCSLWRFEPTCFFNQLKDEKNATLFCCKHKIIFNKFVCPKINLVSLYSKWVIGLHSKGFSPLLAVRFYTQIIRAQLEYELIITKITSFLTSKFEDAQNTCIRRIFSGSSRSSTKVMLHLT